ncbi:molybdopterin-dependent oxidoreductase [Niallia sp. XMNu-256]|uniref:molybdopterin-containing oxidoreductase family protein n=1 Tax=Niallia sp. XMNu-256 TaxID=3082444 RepID=UPI0030CD76E3
MNHRKVRKYHNVCPRNCPSSCTMISHIENDSIHHITGDIRHPYTKGKLCAKGFSYAEKNNHRDRLKYPYYQKVKGSGKFIQITWEKAYQLIISELLNIHHQFSSFLPVALFKGSGNIGVHHYVTDDFFSSLGETTRMFSSSYLFSSLHSIGTHNEAMIGRDPSSIKEASMIIIWGANPAATNIHLIPYIIEAKIKGAKIIVIDPLYTQTAELADLFIQLRPSTDGAFASLLIKHLIEKQAYDKRFLKVDDCKEFINLLNEINEEEYLTICDVSKEALTLLLTWLIDAETVSYVVGTGLQKHSNFRQTMNWIEQLAFIHEDIEKVGGGIFFRDHDSMIFNNQTPEKLLRNNRIMSVNNKGKLTDPPIKMLLISCANPLTQEPDSRAVERFLKEIPFVITIDQFMTPTAQMSNLILPTTTHFEEMDVIISWWHKGIALNEKAISPYYESRSEWKIMTELAEKLNGHLSSLSTFPVSSSEEEYLNAQFNDEVLHLYSIRNVSDLIERQMLGALHDFETNQHFSNKHKNELKSVSSKPMIKDLPPKEYPFWFITPHHPYAFNSQFHFLNLSDESEALAVIHPNAATDLGITNGDIVKIYNEQACIEIKAICSKQVPKDIIMVYQGWYPNSDLTINELLPAEQDISSNQEFFSNNYAFFNTFVKVEKL